MTLAPCKLCGGERLILPWYPQLCPPCWEMREAKRERFRKMTLLDALRIVHSEAVYHTETCGEADCKINAAVAIVGNFNDMIERKAA